MQTASGVPFNVGGSSGNAICNAGGYRVGGAAPSGNYLRGNGTNFVSSPIQAADVPDLDASKITTGVFSTLRIPDLDASKIVSGTIADARLPANLIRSLDGNAYKIKFGSALVSGNGSLVISTGLSSIAAVLITHIFTVTNAAAGSVANVSAGNFTLYNNLSTEEYFYWLAIGTA